SLAFANDGTLIAVTGPVIVGLDAKTLQPKGSFKEPRTELVTGATIFTLGERERIAAGTKDGRVVVVDAAGVETSDQKARFSDSPEPRAIAMNPLATWQDGATGARSLLVPTETTVAALRIEDGRSFFPQPQWVTSRLTAPATPLIVNGVVFVLEQGRE